MYVGSVPESPLILALVALGFCVGVAGSFFGVGGAFIVTPALNILGFPMSYAIGTDLAHMTGKSIVAAIRHRRLGHVDMRAAGLLVVGTLPGVKLGALSVMRLERIGATEDVLRWVYIVLLTVLGSLILRESLSKRQVVPGEALLQRRFRIPPLIELKRSGIKEVSIWSVILLGFATGFLASFLGVGGGFIRMPAMLYLLGMPTHVAVGTDLLEVLVSGGYGAFLYAVEGRVNVIAALIMLVGASFGSHLGTLATRYADAVQIRRYFGITVLGAAVAVASKQAGLPVVSAIILLILGPALAGLILYMLGKGIRASRSVRVHSPE